jgi:hypothetical protein
MFGVHPNRERIDSGWITILGDPDQAHQLECDSAGWRPVTLPHNWDTYHNYRCEKHGSLHGIAWYRRVLPWNPAWRGRRVFLEFEGVGSYADVYCNGEHVMHHAGGRISFWADITDHLQEGCDAVIAVRADHPEKIEDLPFVCGGCWGSPHTEGSQPFGIFRPVHVYHCADLRLEPFGVYPWCPEGSPKQAVVEIRAEVRSLNDRTEDYRLLFEMLSPEGEVVATAETAGVSIPGDLHHTRVRTTLDAPRLWGPEQPALYRVRTTLSRENGDILETCDYPFGIRQFTWPDVEDPDADRNIQSSNKTRKIRDLGDAPPSPENNGYTKLLREGNGTVSLAPMGVEITAPNLSRECARLRLQLHIDNTTDAALPVHLKAEVLNEGGTVFLEDIHADTHLAPGRNTIQLQGEELRFPHCWTPRDPYLHKVILDIRDQHHVLLQRTETTFGFFDSDSVINRGHPVIEILNEDNGRTVERKPFLLNGTPFFHNGEAEYEHLLGNDHAFSDAQVASQVDKIAATGFNAFRDGHHPHNLRYYEHLDRRGVICWTQMGSHIYFDNDAFRDNMRRLTRQWVRERRNHPCIAVWGLQNESSLPPEFARELREIVRAEDPTSPAQRPTTTCNGGKGSDWNVPQEWSGTYGGNCNDYDLEQVQLVGEYGAWRHLGVHGHGPYSGNEDDFTESYHCYLLETKIRRAEAVRDKVVGHYHWILASFVNPGRSPDCHEGPGNAAIGPINNKGLMTAWHEPTDSFYLYMANYLPAAEHPMVYIVSHTSQDLFTHACKQDVHVYSNCDEVELFNDVDDLSLGRLANPGRGRHFTWEQADLRYGVLEAKGYVEGKRVAHDTLLLHALPPSPHQKGLFSTAAQPVQDPAGEVILRMNCGGGEYTDSQGRTWLADTPWQENTPGWLSWGNDFETIPDDLASRGQTWDPITGTTDPTLYQTFRWGRDRLRYRIPVTPGRYTVQAHFIEPWYGTGGGWDYRGWRLFDVAINDQTVEQDLDIFAEVGHDRALLKSWTVDITGDRLDIHFPRIDVNQAILCAFTITRLALCVA